MPLLFGGGGKLIDQLVSKSKDMPKTQKGFDHIFAAHYWQVAAQGTK